MTNMVTECAVHEHSILELKVIKGNYKTLSAQKVLTPLEKVSTPLKLEAALIKSI